MWPPSTSDHGCHSRELYVKSRRTFRPRPGRNNTGTVRRKLLLPTAAAIGRSIKVGNFEEILTATGSRPRLFSGANAVLMMLLSQPRMAGPQFLAGQRWPCPPPVLDTVQLDDWLLVTRVQKHGKPRRPGRDSAQRPLVLSPATLIA